MQHEIEVRGGQGEQSFSNWTFALNYGSARASSAQKVNNTRDT